MITINSFEYYGPYIIHPSRHFFEGMLRCHTPKGEMISKNIIIAENGIFDPRQFPLLRRERLELVDKYVNYMECSSQDYTYYMVDAYVTIGQEKAVLKMLETDCTQRTLCLLLLTEETRLAMQQVGKLDLIYCVAHLNEKDAENNELPAHMHMTFRAKETPSEETLQAVKEIAEAEFAQE